MGLDEIFSLEGINAIIFTIQNDAQFLTNSEL